jgi:hypothetical protein
LQCPQVSAQSPFLNGSRRTKDAEDGHPIHQRVANGGFDFDDCIGGFGQLHQAPCIDGLERSRRSAVQHHLELGQTAQLSRRFRAWRRARFLVQSANRFPSLVACKNQYAADL